VEVRIVVACLVVTACAGSDSSPPVTPAAPARDAGLGEPTGARVDAAVEPPAPGADGERWLKGSTHVHAAPSGDSTHPIPAVVTWYESRGYDFIALTDHNRVSEVGATSTRGQVAVRAPEQGLIVLAGVELTHNPDGCIPAGDASGRCRIHVNLLGASARPAGKIEWAAHGSKERVAKYQAALDQRELLGGIAQLNHPQYYWGMTPEVLTEVARRGMRLFEVANVQFPKWNAGEPPHLSTEALWDAALAAGVTLWGVASDDAHDYDNGTGPYPPGGGWVMVRARRDPQAILDALAAGRFYASTGVVLARAEVEYREAGGPSGRARPSRDDEYREAGGPSGRARPSRDDERGVLVVEVDPGATAEHTITFIENGTTVASVRGRSARRAVPARGYVRAIVTRGDGKQAWVQPARRP